MKKRILLLIATFGVAITAASFNFGGNQASATVPYTNAIISVDGSGNQGTNDSADSNSQVSMSQDGRYVLFSSSASNLVSGDTDNAADLFVKDRLTGSVTRVDVSSAGTQANIGGDIWGRISADGKYVAFESYATNFVSGTLPANSVHYYLHNMTTGSTDLIDVGMGGAMPNTGGDSRSVDISADGRYVVFASGASNLVSGDTNSQQDIFVRDTKLSTTTLLSKADSGTAANGDSTRPSINCDGSMIAFSSQATNLVSSDTNGVDDDFLVNRVGGNSIKDLTLSANATSGVEGYSAPLAPVVSCNGSTVLVPSKASNLTSGVTGTTKYHLYAYNTFNDSFELIDKSASGTVGNNGVRDDAISWDGNLIAFNSQANNLSSSTYDDNSYADVYLRNRSANTTEQVSRASTTTSLQSPQSEAVTPSISLDGRYVSFSTYSSNAVSGDTNSKHDVFVAQSGYTPTNY
ncbi:MAG TPA: hypothetical protein VLF59_03840 [Candidatus Saccharimonadales bacterium]|nr:hypothetical protein [Candidatus Saccharimonadales bacterium]